MIRVAILIALLAAIAHATPASERVVIADSDPELQRAIASTLAPWKLEVVIEATAPVDAMQARDRADAQTARFVVWREGNELVVFDRERGEAEHREAPVGALDPVSAAAAALTVKTLMRLPPLPDETAPAVDIVTPPPPAPAPAAVHGGPEIRIQAGLATRVARGTETEIGGRAVIGALVRPWSRRGWRFGIAGDLGTPAQIQKSGFKGTWTDWAVLGLVSWTHAHGVWELEPHAGGGAVRSILEGNESMMDRRRETAMLGMARVGLSLRRRLGAWSVGADVGLDAVFGTPTYTKVVSVNEIFRVPAFACAFGVFAAADLNR